MIEWSKAFLTGTIGLGLIMILVLLGLLVWSVVVPTGTYEEEGYVTEADAKYESLSIDTIDTSVEFTAVQGYVTVLSYQEGGKWDNYDTFAEVLSSSGIPLFDIVGYSYQPNSAGEIGEIVISINAHGNDVRVIMENEVQP